MEEMEENVEQFIARTFLLFMHHHAAQNSATFQVQILSYIKNPTTTQYKYSVTGRSPAFKTLLHSEHVSTISHKPQGGSDVSLSVTHT